MDLATFETDYWQLVDAEHRHGENPKKFWIPARADRESLQVGDAAKLVFEIEVDNTDGQIEVEGERMWVIVTGRIDDTYVGVLDNTPVTFKADADVYLCRGAEVPFRPEHVIDIRKNVVTPGRIPVTEHKWRGKPRVRV